MKYKRRKDGRYHTSVGTGVYDDLGREKRINVYAYTEEEFLEKLAEAKYEAKHGIFSKEKRKFGDYALLWYSTFKDGNYNYYNIIKNHLTSLSEAYIKDITRTDIQECINKNKGHYDLQRRQRMTINQIMESAIEDGLIDRNPCTRIVIDKKPPTKRHGLTKEGKKMIVQADLPEMEKVFLMILFYTGMRRGEVFALKKTDFDFKGKTIRVEASVSYLGEIGTIKTTKTENGVRTVDLLSHLEKYVKPYIEHHEDEYLFTYDGKLLTRTRARGIWKRIERELKRQGMTEHITPHFLRHSFATDLYYSGIDIKKAQRIMGHADTKMLLDIYTHLDEEKSQSRDKLESQFNIE